MKNLYVLLAVMFAAQAVVRIYFFKWRVRQDAKWLAKHFGHKGPNGLDQHVAEVHNRRFGIIYLVLAAVFAVLAYVDF